MYKGNISFCVFSDLHCILNSNIHRILANNIGSQIERKNIEFIVNLGDSIGTVKSKGSAFGILKDIAENFAKLTVETYYVTGNHDLELIRKDEFNAATLSARKENYYSFDHGDFHFIVLDMNYHENGISFANGDFEWFNAFMPDDELFWLKNDLKENIKRPTFIFTHQNLDKRKVNNENHPEIISNADEVRNTLELATNVIAVFQGHGHRRYRKYINGIEYISIASSAETPVFTIVKQSTDILELSCYPV